MSTDLNLTGFKYNIAAAVFFVRQGTHSFHDIADLLPRQITYSLAEVPSYVYLHCNASILTSRVETLPSSISDLHAGVSRRLPCVFLIA
jgi:hypothetical protein